MRTAGVEISDIGQIREYDTVDEMLSAVANGTCTGTGLSEALWEANADDFSESISVINTTAPVPYGVLIMPFEAPLAARLSLTDALVDLDAPQIALGDITPEATADTDDAPSDNDESEAETDTDDTPDAEATESSGTINLLLPFIGEGEFVRVEEGDFSDLLDFLDETGLNLSQLGQ
jgi:hypothetical protein